MFSGEEREMGFSGSESTTPLSLGSADKPVKLSGKPRRLCADCKRAYLNVYNKGKLCLLCERKLRRARCGLD